MKRALVLLSVMLVVTMFGAVASCANPAPAEKAVGISGGAATLIITPLSGAPKAKITIIGSGFVPGEEVEIIGHWFGIDQVIGTKDLYLSGEEPILTANEEGAFIATSVIPAEIKLGVYTVKAVGKNGSLATSPLVAAKAEKKK